jgi:hypothetical protein
MEQPAYSPADKQQKKFRLLKHSVAGARRREFLPLAAPECSNVSHPDVIESDKEGEWVISSLMSSHPHTIRLL